MAKEVIDIRESEMSEIKKHLNKSFSNIDKLSQNLESSFANITKTGLLSKSTKTIGNQMKTIARQINKSVDSVSKTYENMYFVEKVLEQKAEEINAPIDFCKNDVTSDISITVGNLSKNDGKSIANGNMTTEKELDFKGVLEYNEKLKNIVHDYESNIEEIEINGDKTKLENINKSEKTVDKEIDLNQVEKQVLNKINNNINENHPEFNDSFKLEKANVEVLENNKEDDVDEIYKEVLEEVQEKLNDGNYTLENHNE